MESDSAQICPLNSANIQKREVLERAFLLRGAFTDPGTSCVRTHGNMWTRRNGATPNSPISSPRNHPEADGQNSVQWIAWSAARQTVPTTMDANAAAVVTEM